MKSYVLMLQTDADDRNITELILSDIHLTIPVKFVADIDDFESFITVEGRPALIIISESNKKFKAVEIVKQLKSNPAYSHIPMVILAEQSPDEYIKESYAAGASTFITKPSTVELTKKKIEGFFTYWLNIAELPAEIPVETD